MADFVSLTCPSCQGKLQIGRDLEGFACSYCGTEYVVNRGGGVVSLSPVVDGLKRVERGVDRTASELAIARLQNDVDKLLKQLRAVYANSNSGRLFALGLGLLFFGFVMSRSDNGQGYFTLIGISVLLLIGGIVSKYKDSKTRKEIEH